MNLELKIFGVFLLSRGALDDMSSPATILIPNCFDRSTHEDDTLATPHHPFLVVHPTKIDDCVVTGTGAPESLKYMECVLRFDPDAEPGNGGDVDVDWGPYSSRPLVQIHTFHPRLCIRDHLSPFMDGPEARLTCQLTIPRGTFQTCAADGTAKRYELRGQLAQRPQVGVGMLRCTVRDVPAAFLDYRTSADGDWRFIDLSPATGDTAYASIGNLCTDNPLKWPDCHIQDCVNDEVEDLDFKWIYRLLLPCETGKWPDDLEGFFSYPVGFCNSSDLEDGAPGDVHAHAVAAAASHTHGDGATSASFEGATTSTCWGGECEFC
jgi:hypothetical protein